MPKAFVFTKRAVLLAAAVFIAVVVCGVFTALDSVGHVPQGETPVEKGGAFGASAVPASGDALNAQVAGAAPLGADGAALEAAPSVSDDGSGDVAETSYPVLPETPPHPPASQPSAQASKPAAPNGTAPAPEPQKTYYPAWDEWVVSGYWEVVEVPAVMGQREVYGSVCNECGAGISGQAAAHLKATRHSGYHEGVVGYESYEISPATSERVWADTSHWVRHEAYWD